ncbi:hypothetical protein Q5752_003306 [Cryptotrichosporon argae]
MSTTDISTTSTTIPIETVESLAGFKTKAGDLCVAIHESLASAAARSGVSFAVLVEVWPQATDGQLEFADGLRNGSLAGPLTLPASAVKEVLSVPSSAYASVLVNHMLAKIREAVSARDPASAGFTRLVVARWACDPNEAAQWREPAEDGTNAAPNV